MLSAFAQFCLAGVVTVAATARARRGTPFAVFAIVFVGLQAVATVVLQPHLRLPIWLLVAIQLTIFAHYVRLSKPRMGSPLYSALVSGPALAWIAGAILALPWVVVSAFGGEPWAPWLPFAIAGVGLVESMWLRPTTVDIDVTGEHVDGLRRVRAGSVRVERPLRIVQITDPHLGPFMSEPRLRRICERAVAHDPDIVLLTGDFLTMQSRGEPNRLAHGDRPVTILGRALEPLRALEGRTFACFGNHDHDAPDLVRRGLAEAGVRLLVDEAVDVDTPAGPVQIVGADFVWRGRDTHLERLAERCPRRAGRLRIVLLHDPGAFAHVPVGTGDLVLAGHTHGGQLGLVTLGLPWTFVSLVSSIPDHGLWGRGRDRLYVHRGTGHYGFPVRIGVPAEESLMRVHIAPDALPVEV